MPQPAPPQPDPPYPDSLLGSLTATCHHSAGSPHAAEPSQMGGAPDRHCGDCKVLGGTRESTQECRRGDTGCIQLSLLRAPLPMPFQPPSVPRCLPPTKACPTPHSESVCHDLRSSVIGPLGQAYEKLPAWGRRGLRARGNELETSQRRPSLSNSASLCQAPRVSTPQPHQ